MVFYFTSTVVDPPVTLFMGLDKHENENLIKWGWPEDVWFHVDKVSSAHVYLRLGKDQTLDEVPLSVIEDAAQLVKANSISGNKMNDVDVVYTLWSNLHKNEGTMEIGQVGFHKNKEVKKIRVEKRNNTIINRLNRTKVEKTINFQEEREQRDHEDREAKKQIFKQMEEAKKVEELKRKEELYERSYDRIMKEENMVSNRGDGNDSDDFM